MFENKENQRFDVEMTLTLKSRGDFGCIRIGNLSRSIEECIYEAEEVRDDILRHVDGIESVSYKVIDEYQEYKEIPEWTAQSIRNKSWEGQKGLLEVDDRYDPEEVLHILRCITEGDFNIPEDTISDLEDVIERGIKDV